MNGFPILGSRGPMEESRPFPRLSSPPDSNASSPTPSSLESYGERELGVHPSEKVFNFPASSSADSGGPVTLTSLTPISPSNEVAAWHTWHLPVFYIENHSYKVISYLFIKFDQSRITLIMINSIFIDSLLIKIEHFRRFTALSSIEILWSPV